MPSENLVTSQEFVRLTNMDAGTYYVLYIDGKLPIVEWQNYKYIDMNDIRARKWLPGYVPEPVKDLFA